jgi:hypothetical protein
MTFKRKPPSGNIRRVAPIGGNLRYTVTGKADQTIQCESFLERKLTLRFDRDPSIRTYVSQPEQFPYVDTQGKTHTYTPDFMVWRITGEVEIYEVTLTSRRNQSRLVEREKAARQICKERGWQYVVHTEATLPQPTEEANLLALARYRPTAYARPDVTCFVKAHLPNMPSPVLFHTLITEVTQHLHLPEALVVPTLCHLLCQGVLEIDLCHQLIFQDARPRVSLLVWLRSERETR